jgi:glycosyltransferase involved in cell wall biosynthesis
MRILIFNWRDLRHPRAGGAEVFTENIARHWVASGHDVTLFCSSVSGVPERESCDGVDIIRRGSRLGVYREAPRFYREVGGKFDIVIDEINTRPFLCPTFVNDVPVVAFMHQLAADVWAHEFSQPVAVVGQRRELAWLRTYRYIPTLTVSASSKASLQAAGLQRVAVVPEGLDSLDAAWLRPKATVPTVVFVGRLAANKRPDHAVEAFRLARRHLPELRLFLIGSGVLEDSLRKAAPDGVEFLGRVADAEKYGAMSEAHALISTSVREGWGLVVSEAAAAGTVSVGYDVPGLCDSVRAANGVLVQPDPVAMSRALTKVIPEILAGRGPQPTIGGVAPWAEVAETFLARCRQVTALG